MFTFIDFLAGLVGTRLAFEQAGARCVFSSEWEKHCQITYEANFGEKPHGDITSVLQYHRRVVYLHYGKIAEPIAISVQLYPLEENNQRELQNFTSIRRISMPSEYSIQGHSDCLS